MVPRPVCRAEIGEPCGLATRNADGASLDFAARETLAELIALLAVISWGAEALSRASGVRLTTVRRWLNGAQTTPRRIVDWLRPLAAFHRDHPPPPPPPRRARGNGAF